MKFCKKCIHEKQFRKFFGQQYLNVNCRKIKKKLQESCRNRKEKCGKNLRCIEKNF